MKLLLDKKFDKRKDQQIKGMGDTELFGQI